MSGNFILKYAGAPVRVGTHIDLQQDDTTATRFTSEAEAWLAAQQNHLAPNHCTVECVHGQPAPNDFQP